MRRIGILITAASLTVLACGLWDDDGGDPPVLPAADTPDMCMYYVEKAFNQRDITVLKNHVAPNFTFYFNPSDVGTWVNGYVIPTSWTYDAFTPAVTNMFDEAYSISLAVDVIPVPPTNETTFTAQNISVDFLLMIDYQNGFRCNQGYCDFQFEQYEENGVKLWRLTKWWDHTSASLGDGVAPASLGRILAMYR